MVEMLTTEYPTVKFWLSFQCKDDDVHLAHGEVFAEVARKAWNLVADSPAKGNLLAVGVNCLNPQVFHSQISRLPYIQYSIQYSARHTSIPLPQLRGVKPGAFAINRLSE